MCSFEKYEEGFKTPDRRYAIYPIIHANLGPNERVDAYEKNGFAGVVGNINYNRGVFPEDDAAWKRAEQGFRAYAARGMHTWIYDEKGYPSGTAGGYVTEEHPEYIARGLYCYDYWKTIVGPILYRADTPADKLWRAALIPCKGGDPIDVTEYQNDRGVLYIPVPEGQFWLFMMSTRRLFDGTHATESYSEPRNYISLSDVDATKAFMAVTHEKYKAYIGDEFGRSVLAMFTDEPSLISWNIRSAVFPILPWHDKYPEEFRARYGYDFMLACVAVVLGKGEQVSKRRCDFWDYIADTVADGFFGTIGYWCHANNLKSSGHMLEEERLQAHIYNYGSFYRCMKRMDWPGIDQLDTEPGALMRETHIPIARFIASFADINGEHETFTEFSDHSVRGRGETAPLSYYYYSVNWHHAMGINNFTSYYSFKDITDTEKQALNAYTARTGYLLRQGARDSRIAVLYPEAAMWEAYTPSTRERALDFSDRMMSIQNAFVRVSWDLLHRQMDYDYVDADLLIRAEIKDGRLCYGDRSYEAVMLPCARVLEDRAAEKLLAMAEAGIRVYFCKEAVTLSRETGESAPYKEAIAEKIKTGDHMYLSDTIEDFGALIDASVPASCRPVRFETYAPNLLSHLRRTQDGDVILFLANMAEDAPLSGIMTLPGTGDCVYTADCHTGDITPMTVCDRDADTGNFRVEITLAPGEGRFILIK